MNTDDRTELEESSIIRDANKLHHLNIQDTADVRALVRYVVHRERGNELTRDIIRDNRELLDCIHNLMGIFDTPIARRYIESDMAEEARSIGREILTKHGRTTWVKG